MLRIGYMIPAFKTSMLSCGGDEEIPPTSWFVQIPRTSWFVESWFVEFAKQVDKKG